METQKTIKKIVITGGPCGGKSTVIPHIKKHLENKGWKVFLIEEIATRLYTSGVERGGKGISYEAFQEAVLVNQAHEETATEHRARQHDYPNIVILHDRGILDGESFLTPEIFEGVLTKYKYTKEAILNNCYDAIIHLVTAADGAEEFYTLDNNSVRSETLEEARAQDKKIQSAYAGHPHISIIGNEGSFDDKLARTIAAIDEFLETK